MEHPTDVHSEAERPRAIFVNTQAHEVTAKRITFEELVNLAYPGEPAGEADTITITYSRGAAGHDSGTLLPGGSVPVKKGMVFDVVRTTRS